MKWHQQFPNNTQWSENILKNDKEESKQKQTSVGKGHGYTNSLAAKRDA